VAYILGLLIVGLFFTVMHFYTELNAKQKLTATIVVLLFVMGAIFYNTLQSAKADHIRAVMLHFNQGKNIKCDEIDVTKINFTLSIGTQTFIGKPESTHAGKMIQASGCE